MWKKIMPMSPEELQRWERLRRLGRKKRTVHISTALCTGAAVCLSD